MITPDSITALQSNEVFVFGSNEAGRHGRGAAKQAVKFGAVYGQGDGLMGQSYGISTKGRKLDVLPLARIEVKVGRFLRFAEAHPELTFLVTPIGCGLAGYKPKEIAPMFRGAPSNVVLPQSFQQILNPVSTTVTPGTVDELGRWQSDKDRLLGLPHKPTL